jgi:hypothetical protein
MSRIKVFSAPNPNAPVSSTGNYSSGTAVGSSSTVYASQNELDAISQSLASATDAILDNTNRINGLSSGTVGQLETRVTALETEIDGGTYE